jgi:hypothetical protein
MGDGGWKMRVTCERGKAEGENERGRVREEKEGCDVRGQVRGRRSEGEAVQVLVLGEFVDNRRIG